MSTSLINRFGGVMAASVSHIAKKINWNFLIAAHVPHPSGGRGFVFLSIDFTRPRGDPAFGLLQSRRAQ
jgi:hypothetical protein